LLQLQCVFSPVRVREVLSFDCEGALSLSLSLSLSLFLFLFFIFLILSLFFCSKIIVVSFFVWKAVVLENKLFFKIY